MTANQIAAASERELERHNVTVEEETERHNKEMEYFQGRANDITESYNNQKLALEDWYNATSLELQKAQGDRKLDLEEVLNSIKQQQVEADNQYKRDMANIEREKFAADKVYKESMASIGYIGAATEALRLEYQKHQWDESNAISREQIYATRERTLADQQIAQLQTEQRRLAAEQSYNLGLKELETKYANLSFSYADLELRRLQAGASMSLQQSQMIKNYMDSAMRPFQVFDLGL